MFATVFVRNGITVPLFNLAVAVKFYSARAFGGWERAEYAVTGALNALYDTINLLGCQAITRNGNGTVVWMGYVVEVTVDTGIYKVGVSLERMANKVRTAYSYTKLDGGQEQGITDWASDADSLARYGTKEKTLSVNDTNVVAATAKRDTYLARHRYPVPIVTFDTQGKPGAVIICSGPWQMLDWNYYENPLGKEVYDVSGNQAALVGWQLTSADLGFGYDRIHELYGRHALVSPGARFKVSGGANNGKSYTVSGAVEGTVVVHTTTTVAFDAQDDVIDETAGLAWANEQEMVRVSGSASNDGTWLIKRKATDTRFEVTPATIQTAGAGPAVTLRQGVSLGVEETTTTEMAGSAITLTSIGLKVAQSFQVASATGWTALEIGCRAAIKGAPADQLRFALYSNSGGVPTALLGAQTLDNSALTNDLDWVTVQLTSGVALAPATTYWLLVERTGASDYDDFFLVDLNEAAYARGECKLWDGSNWTMPAPVLDMPFQIWGMQDTTIVLKDMLEASPYINAVRIDTASNVLERQWRDGTSGVKNEAERLLRLGTSSGVQLLAIVTENGDCTLAAPGASDGLHNPTFGEDGKLYNANGQPWEEGVLPVGLWLHLYDRQPQIAFFGSISPILIESASYDVDTADMQVVPWGMYEEDDL